MKNTMIELAGSLHSLVQNTHLSISLQGWPATIAVIAICSAGVTAYVIKASHPEWVSSKVEVA